MDFLNSHFDAVLTFLITSVSFLGVMYKKFAVVENRIVALETVEDNLIARLDRIENKIDNFIRK